MMTRESDIPERDAVAARIAALSLPGHDREVALAVHNQARLRRSPIDDVQVEHLLAIGWRAGRVQARGEARAERDRLAEVVDKARAFAVAARAPERPQFWRQPWAEMTAVLIAVDILDATEAGSDG